MKLGVPLVLAGIVLVIIPVVLVNVWPYAHSRNMPEDPSLYPNSYYSPRADRLESWNDNRLVRMQGEEDYAYATRMLETVHNATYHCEPHNYLQSWFTWLTWRTGIYALIPDNNQGVLDLKTFRCGFCHQRAFILARTLRQGGIHSAEILGLDGHVITVITVDNELYALDPDMGTGPVRITGLDSKTGNPDAGTSSRIVEAYQPISKAWGKDFTDNIVDFYLSTDNNIYYVYRNLELRRRLQEMLFSLEKFIEFCFILLGVSLTTAGLLMIAFKTDNLIQLKALLNHKGKVADGRSGY